MSKQEVHLRALRAGLDPRFVREATMDTLCQGLGLGYGRPSYRGLVPWSSGQLLLPGLSSGADYALMQSIRDAKLKASILLMANQMSENERLALAKLLAQKKPGAANSANSAAT